jgi:DNA-binding transcriptional ArsR family regulator
MKKTAMNQEVMSIEDAMNYIEELEETLVYVRDRAVQANTNKTLRKYEVLALLKKHGKMTVSQLAAAIGIDNRNISSQLTYLRKQDGINIATDSKGYKFIES